MRQNEIEGKIVEIGVESQNEVQNEIQNESEVGIQNEIQVVFVPPSNPNGAAVFVENTAQRIGDPAPTFPSVSTTFSAVIDSLFFYLYVLLADYSLFLLFSSPSPRYFSSPPFPSSSFSLLSTLFPLYSSYLHSSCLIFVKFYGLRQILWTPSSCLFYTIFFVDYFTMTSHGDRYGNFFMSSGG